MILEMAKPGTIEQVVIKMQHNCVSDGIQYSGKPFIPIVHEYMLILRKDNAVLWTFQITRNIEGDVRDLGIPTWRDVISSIMEEKKGAVTLDELYQAVEGHKRTQSNAHWRDKIRQTLQMYDQFEPVSRGVWMMAKKENKNIRRAC